MKSLATIFGILILGASGLKAQDCNPIPPNGLQEIMAYSIFQENYSNGQYDFALNYGRWMICKKPDDIPGHPSFDLSRQYPKFIRIYTEIGLSKSDPALKEAYLDSAIMLYSESFEIFTEEQQSRYELYQRRGRFFLENYNNIENGLQRAYGDFEAMFKLDAERTTTLADGYYIKVVLDNIIRQSRKDEALEMIETATPFASPDVQMFFDDKLKELFNTPEERITFYNDKVAENPNDVESLRELADAYDDLNLVAEYVETLRKLHKIQPTFESALQLADVEKGNAKYQAAATMYKEALEKAPNDQQKKEINIDLADVYTSMEQFATAKRYIQAAISVDANYGLAYIKMASLYGQAVTNCTAPRKLEAKDKVVYWVVVDYLNKAKSVDASVTNTVNSQLATYEAVTPSTEDKFFTLGYEQGQRVKVDGSLFECYNWINETTTVR
jgi:tetratricopeptide (TPR) repeat protein